METPRIPAIHEDDWNEAQLEVLGAQKMRGNVQNIFRTLAHHEKLAKRWLVFANHILAKSSLSPREREIAILRAGWLSGSVYEWGQHKVIGKDAGMSDEEIEAIKVGAPDPVWSEHDRFIIKAADELHTDVFISDDTWEGLSKSYDTQQMIDLVFTCGQYRMLAGALNSFGVQLDDDLTGF
ncbi:MAG: carboxymuconolactone decarboxylase family protein [Pseudomonadales bacterium]|nr:carboxymuconolactone decarboxylase family protein [Pseudomonadales bacterium]MBO6566647.1 carboxymuconolactone decarboxylase family protein [Pseudomonadales bacterium]MBO6594978.1 carboxymuconolactone decarboxylase family protein [Pseudomonadales bacterium]MBO6657461.1 carboxymuconolactone decarboxylase family protein [Pseudomonadales bacterium]MBO6821463.1 carboxymuconolactone decarboxylase family protein [Pseudomonadales bacterium]